MGEARYRPTDDDVWELARDAVLGSGLDPSATYRHYRTGHAYRIVGWAVAESDLKPVILYQRYSGGEVYGPVWSRPLADFTARVVDPSGRTVPRFHRLPWPKAEATP